MIAINSLIVPANSELVVVLNFKKHLIQFEEYTNDPNRGMDIPQMPIYYRFLKDRTWQEFYSAALLVKIPEPDFSMPFNVNAVTNALIGFLFVNVYQVIVKPKRFI